MVYRNPAAKGPTIYSSELTESNRQRIRDTIAVAGSKTPPRRVPSPRECAWCDIHKCPDRVSGLTQTVKTTEF